MNNLTKNKSNDLKLFRKRNDFLEQQEQDLEDRFKVLEVDKIHVMGLLNKIRSINVAKACITQANASPEPFYSQAYNDPLAVRNAENFNSLPAGKTNN